MSKAAKNDKDFEQVLLLINEARNRAFAKVNAELVLLYYNVGNIVSSKVADGTWGQGTIDALVRYIESELPGMKGFNRRGLYRMKQFYETYSNPQIVSTVVTQLQITENEAHKFVSTLLTQIQWSAHLHILSKTKTDEEKLFYMQYTVKEKLSVRELERQLNTAVYERIKLGNNIVSKVRTQLPAGLFKDPYIFEFLDIPDTHSETDLERALIKNLQKFIIEIGKGFAYMGNQFRLQVGNKDYFTDLLFYHRDLQCLVLFELKIEEFQPEFLGKLNFYLEALDRDVKKAHENPTIGVLLCKGKDSEVVEYSLARNSSPAIIADYETKLIPRKVLADKLRQLAEIFTKETDK